MILPSILSEASSLVAKRREQRRGKKHREKVDINDDLRKDIKGEVDPIRKGRYK